MKPAATFGWLWYLVALFPVVVQVGSLARADRYLPLVGIFLAVVWGAADLVRHRLRTRAPLALAGTAAVVLFALAAHRQTRYWRNSRSLWEHLLAVDLKSETALYRLSEYEKELGRFQDQAELLRRLVWLNPRHERALNNLCIARYRLGERLEVLLVDYRALLTMNLRNAKALQNYGYLLIETSRRDEAIATLERALNQPGQLYRAQQPRPGALAKCDKPQARRAFESAIACDPQQQKYRSNLDMAR